MFLILGSTEGPRSSLYGSRVFRASIGIIQEARARSCSTEVTISSFTVLLELGQTATDDAFRSASARLSARIAASFVNTSPSIESNPVTQIKADFIKARAQVAADKGFVLETDISRME
jgi:hypothetical protein